MYSGDVYDTPPTGLRVLLAAVCAAGGLLLLIALARAGQVPACIGVFGGLLAAEMLVFTSSTTAGITWTTVAYGLALAVVAILIPL